MTGQRDGRGRRRPRGGIATLPGLAALLLAGLGGGAAEARITSLEITNRTSPAPGGGFGEVGPYEQLDGIARGEVDPEDPLNAGIQDIRLAPRNARGMVEYETDVSILKPVDPSRGNRVLLYDVVNRGNRVATGAFNIGATADNPAGDGFLQRRGYTVVWSGWQGDLLPGGGRLSIRVPVAHEADGSPITGRVRTEFTPNAPAATQTLTAGFSSNTPGYPTVSLDNAGAVLTRRMRQADAPEIVPNSAWAFADCSTVPFPGRPDPQRICLGPHPGGDGFDTDHIYELLYTAKDPLVLGLGFAATRDLVAWLRGSGEGRNPLAGAVDTVLMHGTSQSGRWMRTFLDLGFNESEDHRRVADGMNPHIGSVRGAFNIRFGMPGRLAGTQHTERAYPGNEDSLTYQPTRDPVLRETHGLLDRCRATRTCPRILHTLSSTEYWQSAGSFDTTDPTGTRDLPDAAGTRIYHFAGTQHGGFSPVAPAPTSTGICEQLPNTNSYTYLLRNLLVRLDEWVVDGRAPPPSAHPTIKDGTLIPPEALEFPAIPGVNPNPVSLHNPRDFLWRGPGFDYTRVSGILQEPPVPVVRYRVLLPQVDADGNEVGGLRSTTLQAPLGTYTSWNTRRQGFVQGDACDLTGSFVAFPAREADRKPGDPRPSLEARYGDHAGYVAAVRRAAAALLGQGYLLPEDAEAAIAAAEASAVLR